VWVNLLKQNELLEPDYDDEKGRQEITADIAMSMQLNSAYADQVSLNETT
jgi:hypothetical protein